ncbi:MAG: cytochrome oxidase putative small subunit CydP [Thiobacillaceae bacterium]
MKAHPFRLGPLGREIALVLIIKLILIVTIKLVFFSDPLRPGSEETARALLMVPHFDTTPERRKSHD